MEVQICIELPVVLEIKFSAWYGERNACNIHVREFKCENSRAFGVVFRDIENGGSVDLSIGCLGSMKHEEQGNLYMYINSDEDIDLIFFGLDDAPDCGVPSA